MILHISQTDIVFELKKVMAIVLKSYKRTFFYCRVTQTLRTCAVSNVWFVVMSEITGVK